MSVPTFSIKKTTLKRGRTAKIVILLSDKIREIEAFSFSLEYDPAVLSSPREVIGPMAPKDASLTVNSRVAGHLGILLDSGFLFSAPGGDELEITFDVAADAPLEPTPIRFVGSPAPQSVSDAAGNLIKAAYTNAALWVVK